MEYVSQTTTQSQKKGGTPMTDLIVKDITISVNRIKKSNLAKYGKYQQFISEQDTKNYLNNLTKEQKLALIRAYQLIQDTKLQINKYTQTKLNKVSVSTDTNSNQSELKQTQTQTKSTKKGAK